MRQVVVDAYGPPGVLAVVDRPDPQPGPHEVLVRVAAAGVNFLEIYQRSGAYTVRFPWTPGIEGSGVVLQLGPEVTGVAEGDRVAWMGHPGAYATHCVVPADRLVPVPDTLSLTDAAAALVQGMTAHFLATDVVPLAAGHTSLVHAAAGGVGRLLCQYARLRGADVIGTVSRADKVAEARAAGANHVIDRSQERFADRAVEITRGRGVDVVFDAVGRDTFEEGLMCLRARGTFVLYGQTSGPVAAIDPQALNARGSLYFTKASLSHYDTTPAQLRRRAETVLSHVAHGKLRLRVHRVYPLEEVADAHAALESRRVTGKVLLRPVEGRRLP